MILVNETKVVAGWTLAFERDGREMAVVALKATFALPTDAGELELAPEQAPLTKADEFAGEPGASAPLHETDFAPRKAMCDVLLNGSAYARDDTGEERVTVEMQVGPMVKAFQVVGSRTWRQGPFGISMGRPAPFSVMAISYERAFGGVDDSHHDPAAHRTFLENPVGTGFHPGRRALDGRPAPNTEEPRNPVTDPGSSYRPMSFGPVGRNWQPRAAYAGTYDAEWLERRAPLWPDDFDDRYFQSAPHDQRMPYPVGGEPVVLRNLTPSGLTTFRLPTLKMPVLFIPHQGPDRDVDAVVDTLLIEPDLQRLVLTWRVSLPLRRNAFEIKEAIIGSSSRGSRRARRSAHKRHYGSLEELAAARRRASRST